MTIRSEVETRKDDMTQFQPLASDATSPAVGLSYIAGRWSRGLSAETVRAIDPSTGLAVGPEYTFLSDSQSDEAVRVAEEAFATFAADSARRVRLLEKTADNLQGMRTAIVSIAHAETGLGARRLEGELDRTTSQLRMFADIVKDGGYRDVRISDTGVPGALLEQHRVPLGPVLVFGASNFPLAFSAAGGDTASALAAGCPVIFKAHNAHPGTDALAAHAIANAVSETGTHPGAFSLVYGSGRSAGQRLVADPRVTAVAFTGSRQAGLSIVKTANARPVPIPVYAEMSSINPVFLFPGALEGGNDTVLDLARGFLGALTGSAGQLCTEPGLVFVPDTSGGRSFIDAVRRLVGDSRGQTMLTTAIASAYEVGVERLSRTPGVRELSRGVVGEGLNAPASAVFETDVDVFLQDRSLHREVFGSASLLVTYPATADDVLPRIAASIEGQLTASVHQSESDRASVRRLLPLLERMAGRVVFNGWPTGVRVCDAVVHGGPFPATSAPRTSSVGAIAVERFLRPVAWQGRPEWL